jgi:hypothetical protein
MNGVATVLRLTTVLTATAAFMFATGLATARDTNHGLSVAIVSNGVMTYKIPTGPSGLELSSNGPGTITVTSGSNSVTVRGPSVTLSGNAVLAPFSTPGVRVTPNNDGGYTVVLDTLLSVLPNPEMPDSIEATSRLAKDLAQSLTQDSAQNLAQDLAQKLTDADFGDRTVTAGRCVAPPTNSASP